MAAITHDIVNAPLRMVYCQRGSKQILNASGTSLRAEGDRRGGGGHRSEEDPVRQGVHFASIRTKRLFPQLIKRRLPRQSVHRPEIPYSKTIQTSPAGSFQARKKRETTPVGVMSQTFNICLKRWPIGRTWKGKVAVNVEE
jgi:hypothetical protein